MGKIPEKDSTDLTGTLLLAMPGMTDPRFFHSVIFLCAHNADGAMGIVINQPLEGVEFREILEQLNLAQPEDGSDQIVHFGGPVETGRGFVLHSGDYMRPESMPLGHNLALTGTTEILKDIAQGKGPKNRLFALGYAGWGPGQLENELQENVWLNLDSDPALIFAPDAGRVWEKALAKLGINPALLSDQAGHA